MADDVLEREIDEAVKRKRLTALQRIRIYDAASGVCCLCKEPIAPKKWIIEHLVPLWLGGADDDSNMAVAHYDCAIAKTSSEAPVKARGDRQRAKHLGIKKPRTITTWRKFNGTIVKAARER